MDGGARAAGGGAGDLLQGDARAGVWTAGARESLEVPADESGALRLLRRIAQGASRGPRERAQAVLRLLRGITSAGGRSARTSADVPMVDADDIVIEALLDDVLDPRMLEDSVDEALRLLQGETTCRSDRRLSSASWRRWSRSGPGSWRRLPQEGS